MSQLGTLYWFVFFVAILPLLGILEKPLTPPATIEADFRAHYGSGEEGMANDDISKPAE